MSAATLAEIAADLSSKLRSLNATPADLLRAMREHDATAKRQALREAAYRACTALALAEPALPINRDFFERVGESRGIHASGSVVETRYYEALRAGLPSVHALRLNP
jgi:hypothetical protein